MKLNGWRCNMSFFNPVNLDELANRNIGVRKNIGNISFKWDGKRWKKPTATDLFEDVTDEDLNSVLELVEAIKKNKSDLETIKNNLKAEFNNDKTQVRFKNGDGTYTDWTQIKGEKGDVGATFTLSSDEKTLTINT